MSGETQTRHSRHMTTDEILEQEREYARRLQEICDQADAAGFEVPTLALVRQIFPEPTSDPVHRYMILEEVFEIGQYRWTPWHNDLVQLEALPALLAKIELYLHTPSLT